MAENNEGWEVWAERLPDVETKQELPEGVWEDYKKYQMLNNREGDWSAPEMKKPDALTKIRNLMGKVKDLPDTMSYYAHKVADPMYANVDYMGQQVGDWAAKKINNIARAFDVSPEARQYGRFEEEEYDPEAVDVRFGRNAYKEGYDNLGDYLEAKDQEKVDRYRGYNHANRFAPIENADDKFYALSDTQTMEDWKPETTSGKIAKGAIETAGNMLPENLKALMEEKGIEGGAKMLGALAPTYVKLKEQYLKAKEARIKELDNLRKSRTLEEADELKKLADIEERHYNILKDIHKEGAEQLKVGRNLPDDVNVGGFVPSDAKRLLTTDEYKRFLEDRGLAKIEYDKALETIKTAPKGSPDYIDAQWTIDHYLQEQKDTLNHAITLHNKRHPIATAAPDRDEIEPIVLKSMKRNAGKQPKPLPNPQAQRAEALRRNLVEDYRTMKGNATNGTPLIPEETYYGSPKQDPAVLKSMARNVEKEARQKYLVNKPTAKPVFDTGYGDIYQARNAEEAKMINALNNVKKEYPHLEWQYDPETSDAVGKFVVQVAEPEGGFARVIEFNDTQDFLDFMKDADRYGQLP